MGIDESDILLGAALLGALPYALAALLNAHEHHPLLQLQQLMHRIGSGMHRHG